MGERKFVNPYHFISFPKTKETGYTDEDMQDVSCLVV